MIKENCDVHRPKPKDRNSGITLLATNSTHFTINLESGKILWYFIILLVAQNNIAGTYYIVFGNT